MDKKTKKVPTKKPKSSNSYFIVISATKKAKFPFYLFYQQNSVNLCKDFTLVRKKVLQTLRMSNVETNCVCN